MTVSYICMLDVMVYNFILLKLQLLCFVPSTKSLIQWSAMCLANNVWVTMWVTTVCAQQPFFMVVMMQNMVNIREAQECHVHGNKLSLGKYGSHKTQWFWVVGWLLWPGKQAVSETNSCSLQNIQNLTLVLKFRLFDWYQ